ncbi:nuclear transport factor 2 family protein [Novosphingobium sp. SG720]|uniref:nuclear transport factor 2 family protein n=1 Tax=Novosphingobium sp. SG720 TaxID=2586998 RepID=UPI001446AB24|nr:nuclear transport factor 2 family protein [Novosphingobium sp. SG720]NKJ42177.1 hypothetical protein [Novosphingobium sp. SG720]
MKDRLRGPAPNRRTVLAAGLGVALGAGPGVAAGESSQSPGRPSRGRFDRAAYARYIALMNAGDLRFVDYYADDVRFVMGIRGRADVRAFYQRQQPFVRERLDVLFFCADTHGAAAQVRSEIRCIRDCDDHGLFGRALRAGERQVIRGCLLYSLNAAGQITAVDGPPPEILEPWHSAG